MQRMTRYARGFKVSGVNSGVKPNKQLDLALIFSPQPCSASAVFTKNQFQAAPIQVCKKLLAETGKSNLHAIVVNSGCANACTGEIGLKNSEKMSNAVKDLLNTKQGALVMSTGVIGEHLAIDNIVNSIPKCVKALGK